MLIGSDCAVTVCFDRVLCLCCVCTVTVCCCCVLCAVYCVLCHAARCFVLIGGVLSFKMFKLGLQVMFPNTGFWTFIKYTIVERHSYQMNPCPADADKRECEVLPADLSWEHQALLAVGFFQMTGWNRYGNFDIVLDLAYAFHTHTPLPSPVLRAPCRAVL